MGANGLGSRFMAGRGEKEEKEGGDIGFLHSGFPRRKLAEQLCAKTEVSDLINAIAWHAVAAAEAGRRAWRP